MAIVLKTYGEQLAEVQTAITAVMSGQRYSLGGRELVRADLEMLNQRESKIQANLDKYGNVSPNMTARTGMGYGVSFG